MRQELMELCKVKMGEDGLYAIALAVLLGHKTGVKTGQKRSENLTSHEIKRTENIKEWLDSVGNGMFCALDVWVDCFKKPRESYDNIESRAIGRALSGIEGCSKIGVRVSSRFGQQRHFRYIKPEVIDYSDVDLDDDLPI